MDLIDTHCHLNFKAFGADFLSVAENSKQRGVKKAIIVGSDGKSSSRALEVAKKINVKLGERWAVVAVGIHPTHFPKASEFEEIAKLSEDELVVAIGETGFDLYRLGEETVDEQRELFRLHCQLAQKINKPLIFHNRAADEVFTKELERLKGAKGVFHCFSSDHSFAKKVVASGFMISFTGNITYGNKKLKKVLKRVPLEKIMVETDAPYIVPEPQRTQGVERNEPYLAGEVIKKIASVKELEVEKVSAQILQNSKTFFYL